MLAIRLGIAVIFGLLFSGVAYLHLDALDTPNAALIVFLAVLGGMNFGITITAIGLLFPWRNKL